MFCFVSVAARIMRFNAENCFEPSLVSFLQFAHFINDAKLSFLRLSLHLYSFKCKIKAFNAVSIGFFARKFVFATENAVVVISV